MWSFALKYGSINQMQQAKKAWNLIREGLTVSYTLTPTDLERMTDRSQGLTLNDLRYINLPRLNRVQLLKSQPQHNLRSAQKYTSHWNDEQRSVIIPIENRKGWAFTDRLAQPRIAKYFLNLRQARSRNDSAGDLDKNVVNDADAYLSAPKESEPFVEPPKKGRRGGKGRRPKAGGK